MVPAGSGYGRLGGLLHCKLVLVSIQKMIYSHDLSLAYSLISWLLRT